MISRTKFVIGVVVLLTTGIEAAYTAAPDVKSLFPAGAQRGGIVEVTATGTLAPWPVRAYVEGSDLRIEPTKTEGKFTVFVDPDAVPGLRWIRFVNDEGVSAARPFVVGTLAEVNEIEPNEDLPQATDVGSEPLVVNGSLSKGEKAADIDVFRVRLKKGATLVACADANRTLGSPIDGVLQIVSAAGFVLTQSNDELGLDPRIVFTAPTDGDYFVRLFGFPSVGTSAIRYVGDPAGIYRLTLTTGPYVDYAFPPVKLAADTKLSGWNLVELLTPKSQPTPGTLQIPSASSNPEHDPAAKIEVENPNGNAAQMIAAPVVVGGRIERPGDRDVYAMKVLKGQGFQIRVISQELAFPVDPLLKIESPDGTQLLRSDDGKRGEYDVDATYRAAADGEIRLVVEDLFSAGGERYVYLLDVRAAEPGFALSLAATELFAEAGKELEIPVSIERQNGLSAEIEIGLEGLPTDFGKPTAVSSGKGDTAKKVTLKLTPPKTFTGVIRVVGKTIDPPPPAEPDAKPAAADTKPAAKPVKAPPKAVVKETPKFSRTAVTKVVAVPGASVDQVLFVVGPAKKPEAEKAKVEKPATEKK